MGAGCAKDFENQKQKAYGSKTFTFIKVVGKGGFGRVWTVKDKKNNNIYALKVIDKAKVLSKKSVNSVMNERNLLVKLNHPFIVNMVRGFQDRQNLYLVLDYLNGGDLRYYINRGYKFSEEQIKFIVQCILEGLQFLHGQNIIHRDIKPENLIFDSKGYIRITDLGVARQFKFENCNETSGTPGYMAPEVMLRQNHSFSVDYFALGVIAYELVMGRRPFNGRSRKQIRDDMLAKQAKITNCNKVSTNCIDFINKMIQRVPRRRLGFNGIHQIFAHPWLQTDHKDKINFYNRKKISPITLLEVKLHSSVQEVTQPDDLYRENRILLKKLQVQELFMNYQYSPQQAQFQQHYDNLKNFQKTSASISTNLVLKEGISSARESSVRYLTARESLNSTFIKQN